MAITSSEIQQLIQAALPDAVLHIEDLAGDGDHYAVHVTSERFASKSRIQQHQMVYEALGGRVGRQLHALSIQTSLPSISTSLSSATESES
ncbi:MAG: bolA protein [Alphaproteobacteria bacterium]|jgi:stress-induced morphogen|nr:bolA protein [Alphaproteobacteria bacterium]